MTTVINFNILNFFKLKLDSYTVNDVRINNQVADERQYRPSETEDVIDITPYSKVVPGNDIVVKRETISPAGPYHQSEVVRGSGLTGQVLRHVKNYGLDRAVMNAEAAGSTYDRNGNIVQCRLPKGMHIDSYA